MYAQSPYANPAIESKYDVSTSMQERRVLMLIELVEQGSHGELIQLSENLFSAADKPHFPPLLHDE